MEADLPHCLITLLEKLVLGVNTEFKDNRNLQNLLLLTTIKTDKSKVMDFVHRLDNFDGEAVAKIARSDQYKLYEEAYEIYKKHDLHEDAVSVLLDQIESIERGAEYAERVDLPAVWKQVGKAQLAEQMITDCIDSFIKANDAGSFKGVIEAAEQLDNWEDLVRYLLMAKKQTKDKLIDSQLIFALAKVERLAQLEEVVSAPNVADIQSIGDRCFDSGMFEAAKILFKNANNNGRLAQCFVQLGQYREAVESARKANGIKTWKYVCQACLAVQKFALARQCGLNIITNPDHLDELVYEYEKQGYTEELIQLLEDGMGLEQTHTGVFTGLGVLYSKYKPEKLMEHIKYFWSRMNTQAVLRACEAGRHWAEAAWLYTETKEYDSAARCMMDHSPTAWSNDRFLMVVGKVRNQELYYTAIEFYLREQPRLLDKILQVLTPKLDHTRVVHLFNKEGHIPLIMKYLLSVQQDNVSAVNEAVNETFVEEENYTSLRESIDSYDNFDQIALAQRIEKHELLEFRRISAYLYKKNGRFAQVRDANYERVQTQAGGSTRNEWWRDSFFCLLLLGFRKTDSSLRPSSTLRTTRSPLHSPRWTRCTRTPSTRPQTPATPKSSTLSSASSSRSRTRSRSARHCTRATLSSHPTSRSSLHGATA